MSTNTLTDAAGTLGGFLRDRRARLVPVPGTSGWRRTPGLRREEVADRAGVSTSWYTWLEQGRGGPPSVAALERLARALELDDTGREVMFLLAHHRPPPLGSNSVPLVPHAVQRVLDALPTSPAYVKTPTWDVVAWNAAATIVLSDYAAMPARERNVLRLLFGNSSGGGPLLDWEEHARFAIAVFRAEIAGAGERSEVDALVAELHAASADFRRLWAETGLQHHDGGTKRFQYPEVGLIALDYAAFAVRGAEGLDMVVFTPSSPADAERVEALLAQAA